MSIDGKRAERGLGGYPRVSLREARELAFDNRRALRRGRNPFENRPKRRTLRGELDAAASNAPTFVDAFAAYFEIHSQSWRPKTAADWQASLETYAMPTIGGKRVDTITAANVFAILKPIWNVKTDAVPRIKRRIAAVMAWAVAHGHRTDNPVAAVLPKQDRTCEHPRTCEPTTWRSAAGSWIGGPRTANRRRRPRSRLPVSNGEGALAPLSMPQRSRGALWAALAPAPDWHAARKRAPGPLGATWRVSTVCGG